MTPVRITPLHPSLGAQVAGVDLSAPIDETTRHALTRALADHLALVFHISKAAHIAGMTPEASRAYMCDLLDRMMRPEIVYHHAWRTGDALVIDDRATTHRAHGDYDRSQSRVLWRIIVEGDRPRLY
jgi:taurine dioxygenase